MGQNGNGRRKVFPDRGGKKKFFCNMFPLLSDTISSANAMRSQTPQKPEWHTKQLFLYHRVVLLDSSYYISGFKYFMTSGKTVSAGRTNT